MAQKSLLGKIAFVTGAGSGIGRATCQVLSREGAQIIGADKNINACEETVKILSAEHGENYAIALEVEKKESVLDALKVALKKFSRPPTVIVNCAGITRDNMLLKMSEEDFQNVIDVNLKGTFLVTQIFSKAILEHGLTTASIINIASIVGKYGNIGQVNYCASKAGVELLTKTASKELGRKGIRVNAILPGIIETPMTDVIPDKVKEMFQTKIGLGRFGNPEEVAEVIAFLASDKSSYVNGASIEVTGGL